VKKRLTGKRVLFLQENSPDRFLPLLPEPVQPESGKASTRFVFAQPGCDVHAEVDANIIRS
jgi:hypothetical protein